MAFNEKNIVRDTGGRFDEKPQSAAEAQLLTPPRCPRHGGEWGDDLTCEMCTTEAGDVRPVPDDLFDDDDVVTVWAIEGDDHEVELVEADTAEEALSEAAERFSQRYDDGECDPDVLSVAGKFRGDIDDFDSLVFVPTPEAGNEARAMHVLESAW